MKEFWQKSRSHLLGFGALVSVPFFLLGCGSEEPEAVGARPVFVWSVPDWADTERVHFSGQAKSPQEVRLSFRVSGEIEELAVFPGKVLEEGDLVARLDPTDYELEVQRMESNLARAEAQLVRAEADYQRTRALFEADNVSRSVLDRDRALFDSAEGEKSAAEKSLELAQQQLSHTTLRAPREGTVSRVPVEQFQSVQAGTLVATMSSLERLRVETGVSERVIARIERGGEAEVFFDRFPERSFAATVVEVAVEPTRMATWPVTVELAERDNGLRPGMAGRVEFLLPLEAENVLFVPPIAISQTGTETPYAWVVNEEGRVSRREVETGTLRDGGLEVRGGLEPGDHLVVRGVRFMEEGLEVEVREVEEGDLR
ncbi:MAG: efflux RND transporter periplasmic adaptor subunit [Opitutales bacterium]|nr:efflux RND transporter periplasmic adaptor subunit [Opitutales bacterium]MCH8539593.1 efflux RND transporter periplasmic adaptor subunit [Opitutales bacterium]